MNTPQQLDALRLADWLNDQYDPDHLKADAATELRRQYERIAALEAARIAYASEFEPDADGDPDVGSIHANIRALKARLAATQAADAPMVNMTPPATSRDRWMYEQGRLAERDGRTPGSVAAAPQAAPVPPEWRLVPVELLERIQESLGSFVSEQGWSQSDMDTADALDGLLAAAPQPPIKE